MAVKFHHSLVPMLVPIEDVTPWPDNPNNGDVDQIVTSMRVNGVYQAICAQKSTGYVLVGNHRYAALQELGSSVVPVIWLDVDDEEARRIAVADNRIGQLARMDNALLLEHLDELSVTELGLLGTGYDEEWVSSMHETLDSPLSLDGLDDGSGPGTAQRKHTIECPRCGYEFGGRR